eukprot:scaffold559058_cov20-Prasinocladus_malaysianus.AAC.1
MHRHLAICMVHRWMTKQTNARVKVSLGELIRLVARFKVFGQGWSENNPNNTDNWKNERIDGDESNNTSLSRMKTKKRLANNYIMNTRGDVMDCSTRNC